MTAPGPEVREFLQSRIDAHGFLSWLGVRVEAAESGRVVLGVPFDEGLTNPTFGSSSDPSIHGGIAATLVDTAGGFAVRSTLEDVRSGGVATIDLDVSYLRPADGDLMATGDVVRAGHTVGVARVDVEGTADGRRAEVAVGRGSYRVVRD